MIRALLVLLLAVAGAGDAAAQRTEKDCRKLGESTIIQSAGPETVAVLVSSCERLVSASPQEARRLLDARMNSAPKSMVAQCRDEDDDLGVLLCLDVLLHKAGARELRGTRHFDMERNGRMVRRFWTFGECREAIIPGAICLSR